MRALASNSIVLTLSAHKQHFLVLHSYFLHPLETQDKEEDKYS